MSFIKKRLSSLLPGEGQGARASLQHVLTVEWGEHKTVLLDIPQAGPSKDSEMEMSGMVSRADYGDYGRLIDEDDEEEENGRSHGRHDRRMTKRRSLVHSKPSHSGIRVVPSRSVSQPLPPPLVPRPAPPRRQSTNPFEGLRNYLDPLDEEMAYASSIGAGAFNHDRNQTATSPNGLRSPGANAQNSFDNPWEGKDWHKEVDLLHGGSVNGYGSPKGTRDSAGTTSSTSSNPFRQSLPPSSKS